MKYNRIFGYAAALGCLAMAPSCSLNQDPLDTYSDVTEGVTEEQEEIVFSTKSDVDSYLTAMYKLFEDRPTPTTHTPERPVPKSSPTKTTPSKALTAFFFATGRAISRMRP